MITRVRLVRLSICGCGFPLLKEDIPLGTEYDIAPAIVETCHFICGGCKAEQDVECVYVLPRGESRAGYLPTQVFEQQNQQQ